MADKWSQICNNYRQRGKFKWDWPCLVDSQGGNDQATRMQPWIQRKNNIIEKMRQFPPSIGAMTSRLWGDDTCPDFLSQHLFWKIQMINLFKAQTKQDQRSQRHSIETDWAKIQKYRDLSIKFYDCPNMPFHTTSQVKYFRDTICQNQIR